MMGPQVDVSLVVILLLGVVFVVVAVLGVVALFWIKGWRKQQGFPVEPPKDKGTKNDGRHV